MKFSSISWSLVGLALPLVFAVVAIPFLLERIGSARFGLLSLFWAMLGYASVFDLGIGRALTQKLSEGRTAGSSQNPLGLMRAAITTTAWAASAGSLIIMLIAVSGLHYNIVAEDHLLQEVGDSLWIMAVVLPLQSMSATWRGVCEAFEGFRAISLIRAFLGAANFGGPLIVSFITPSLSWLVGSLFLSRCLGFWLYRRAALNVVRSTAKVESPTSTAEQARNRRELLRFGGWVTVSALVSPFMVYSDRFLIATYVSASAVAIYTVPFELVTQALILVGAVTSVAFPTLARLRAEDPERARRMFSIWVLIVGGGMAVVGAIIAAALPFFIPLWTKGQLPHESVLIGQVLCVGIVANSVGSMYYARLHSEGRSRATAVIHLIELPLYAVMLVVLIRSFGALGAAIAWSSRMALDAALLKVASLRSHV